jgi:hypothetical protein
MKSAIFLFRSFVFSAVLVIPTRAQNVTTLGSGRSCGTWTMTKPGSLGWVEQGAWMFGFLSGAVTYGNPPGDPLHNVDADAILAWVSSYCATHPLDHFIDAAKALMSVLAEKSSQVGGREGAPD